MQVKTLTEASLLVSLFIIMVLMAYYIPLASMVFVLFLSLPHAVLTWRHNWKVGVLAIVVSAILLAFVVDIVVAFTTVALFATVGVAIGYGAKNYTAGWSIIVGALVSAVCLALVIVIVAQITGINIIEDMVRTYEESLKIVFESGQVDPGFSLEDVQKQLALLTGAVFPAVIFMFGFMSSYISYRVFQLVGKKLKINIPKMPSLFEWQFPKWVGLMYIVGMIFSIFGFDQEIIYNIGMNLVVVFTWPILLQGISIIVLFMSKYISAKIFYIIFVIIIFTNPLLSRIVGILGLFDMFFNYRGWIIEKGAK